MALHRLLKWALELNLSSVVTKRYSNHRKYSLALRAMIQVPHELNDTNPSLTRTVAIWKDWKSIIFSARISFKDIWNGFQKLHRKLIFWKQNSYLHSTKRTEGTLLFQGWNHQFESLQNGHDETFRHYFCQTVILSSLILSVLEAETTPNN